MTTSVVRRYCDTLTQMGYPAKVESGTRCKNVWFEVLGTRYVLGRRPLGPRVLLADDHVRPGRLALRR